MHRYTLKISLFLRNIGVTHDTKSAPRFGRAGASSTPPPFAPAPFYGPLRTLYNAGRCAPYTMRAAAHLRRKYSMRREERPGASAHRSRNLRSASANDAGHFCRTFSLFSERCGPLFTRGPLKKRKMRATFYTWTAQKRIFLPVFRKIRGSWTASGPLVDRFWPASVFSKIPGQTRKKGVLSQSRGPHGPEAILPPVHGFAYSDKGE